MKKPFTPQLSFSRSTLDSRPHGLRLIFNQQTVKQEKKASRSTAPLMAIDGGAAKDQTLQKFSRLSRELRSFIHFGVAEASTKCLLEDLLFTVEQDIRNASPRNQDSLLDTSAYARRDSFPPLNSPLNGSDFVYSVKA